MTTLEARELRLGYAGRDLVNGLNLRLAPGMVLAILGQNGSGKTTLLQALAGLYEPRSGQVLLEGRPRQAWTRRRWAQRVGILLQGEEQGYFGTVAEFVALGRYPHGDGDRQPVARALSVLELEHLAGAKLAQLSGGEQQRARIAQVMAQSPAVYLLDEPLAHLDLRHQVGLLNLLRDLARAGATVALSLHEPWRAARCAGHALLLHGDGRWELGDAAESLTPSRLAAFYGCPAGELYS
jgi:iron complex transport system ATP-binding protein